MMENTSPTEVQITDTTVGYTDSDHESAGIEVEIDGKTFDVPLHDIDHVEVFDFFDADVAFYHDGAIEVAAELEGEENFSFTIDEDGTWSDGHYHTGDVTETDSLPGTLVWTSE